MGASVRSSEAKWGGHPEDPSYHASRVPKQRLVSCTLPQGRPHTLPSSRSPTPPPAAWLPPPGPAVTQTQIRLKDVSFPFNKETKQNKRKWMWEERVFKVPSAKNCSHPLMPDFKSLGTHRVPGWLAQPGCKLARGTCHQPSLRPSFPFPDLRPTALGSHFGPCSP